jgi:molybdate transport system ATP-binding protein
LSDHPFCILQVEGLTINRSGQNLLDEISFSLYQNESLAITGPSGSGKTLLGLALAGKIFYRGEVRFAGDTKNRIVWVEQQHHFKNLQHTSDLYYQQRFNSYDTEETETVVQSLGDQVERANELFREMGIEYLKDERLIQLSNGENKKLQLLKTRLEDPDVILLDQPFIGLDKETRAWLHLQFNKLIESGTLLVLITGTDEIPSCITKVLSLKEGRTSSFQTREEFQKGMPARRNLSGQKSSNPCFQKVTDAGQVMNSMEPVIEMRNVTVQYGNKLILENINWKVVSGQRWLLTGANGAGKSTLLSLITADNPKAYSNHIILFGKKRGSGESIWDIKKRIGFISPELHLFFDQSFTCFETVASGLFDTIGLFRQLSDEEEERVNQWMECCHVNHLRQKRLYELSAGEQRSVLLTRALVKDPPLLIFDEPCQGLDTERKSEFLQFIEDVCINGNKTMIFVSHYEDERPACISHFIKLDHGRVEEIR